jgi:hypothetical protein
VSILLTRGEAVALPQAGGLVLGTDARGVPFLLSADGSRTPVGSDATQAMAAQALDSDPYFLRRFGLPEDFARMSQFNTLSPAAITCQQRDGGAVRLAASGNSRIYYCMTGTGSAGGDPTAGGTFPQHAAPASTPWYLENLCSLSADNVADAGHNGIIWIVGWNGDAATIGATTNGAIGLVYTSGSFRIRATHPVIGTTDVTLGWTIDALQHRFSLRYDGASVIASRDGVDDPATAGSLPGAPQTQSYMFWGLDAAGIAAGTSNFAMVVNGLAYGTNMGVV